MVADHGRLYDEPGLGGDDPGAGFEEYLTRLNLSGMWVAEQADVVVGFAGLLIEDRHGEVRPLVVTESMRDTGVGSRLLAQVTEEARNRRLRHLALRPAARNLAGMHCAHEAGFDVLTEVTLVNDLTGRRWREGLSLHDLPFDYLPVWPVSRRMVSAMLGRSGVVAMAAIGSHDGERVVPSGSSRSVPPVTLTRYTK
ncbi:GNAT family N-acetyltransferase [Stackebrandtia albiflava]|uniref:GNAT family N-acetyltransferase n=1 Tax=Stackebrandtia albiflava TaxID=406432 RepID=UPI003CD06367